MDRGLVVGVGGGIREAAVEGGTVIGNLFRPFEAEPFEGVSGRGAEVADAVLVADLPPLAGGELIAESQPVIHFAGVAAGGLLEIEETDGVGVEREVVEKTTEDDVPRIAQHDQDFGMRNHPQPGGDEVGERGVLVEHDATAQGLAEEFFHAMEVGVPEGGNRCGISGKEAFSGVSGAGLAGRLEDPGGEEAGEEIVLVGTAQAGVGIEDLLQQRGAGSRAAGEQGDGRVAFLLPDIERGSLEGAGELLGLLVDERGDAFEGRGVALAEGFGTERVADRLGGVV